MGGTTDVGSQRYPPLKCSPVYPNINLRLSNLWCGRPHTDLFVSPNYHSFPCSVFHTRRNYCRTPAATIVPFIQHLDQSMKVLRLAVQCCLEVSKEKSRSGRCTRVLQSWTDLANETLFRKDFLRPFLSFLRTSLSHLHFLLQSSSTEDRSSLDAEVVPRLSSTTAGQMALLDVGRQEPLARPVCPATLTSKS